MAEYYWLVEKPDSQTSNPLYLCAEGDLKTLRFCWSYSSSALRFARKQDAERVARISNTLQPDLWETRKYIGLPRIAQHTTSNDGESA